MRLGALIVGTRGATASTLMATAMSPRPEDLKRFLVTESELAARLPLAKVDEIVWGGWDTAKEAWAETLDRHGVLAGPARARALAQLPNVMEYPALALGADHAVVAGETAVGGGGDPLANLRGDIRDFERRSGADVVVLVYLAAPGRFDTAAFPETPQAFLAALAEGSFETAAPYYVAAAILEGVAVADYTASATLEIPGLQRLAEERGVALAGRDGSTGQTLLKSVLADTFATRRLHITGWYSSNILGNHDGLVLQDERFCDIKRRDKTELLELILGYPVQSHVVDIRYYLPAGDEKEAWDAVDFETWGGGRGQMRVNWRCSDSLLAAPAIIDLVRLLGFMSHRGWAGIRAELGVFFKFALGTPERRYLELARGLREFLAAEVEAVSSATVSLLPTG